MPTQDMREERVSRQEKIHPQSVKFAPSEILLPMRNANPGGLLQCGAGKDEGNVLGVAPLHICKQCNPAYQGVPNPSFFQQGKQALHRRKQRVWVGHRNPRLPIRRIENHRVTDDASDVDLGPHSHLRPILTTRG